MSFEEILEAEYGKGKVYIDYLEEDSKNMANIRIISRDSKKEFRAEAILTENIIEIAGIKYSFTDFINALNTSFEKPKN